MKRFMMFFVLLPFFCFGIGVTGGAPMKYVQEKKEKKFVIGVSIKTSNATFQQEGVPLWGKFSQERMAEKIPNKINQNILAIYTEYEGDYTKPYTYIVGCEVSGLDAVPTGMVGVEIEPASYAVYTAKGAFPQSMLQTWQAIWSSGLKRSYTTDFEVYAPDFNPQNNPEVKIYIGLDR